MTDNVTKRRLSVEERRAHVKLELLIEGNTSKSAIAEKLGCGRKTIKDDIDVMMAENEFWTHNMAAVGWLTNVREMYRSSQIEIARLEKMVNESVQFITEKDDTIIKISLSPSEIAILNNAITAKRKFITELMSKWVLYEKTQQYAAFFEKHDKSWNQQYDQ